jgi:hypothetical protein
MWSSSTSRSIHGRAIFSRKSAHRERQMYSNHSAVWDTLLSIDENSIVRAEYPWDHMYVVQSANARANLSSIEIIWYLGKNCMSVGTVHIMGP